MPEVFQSLNYSSVRDSLQLPSATYLVYIVYLCLSISSYLLQCQHVPAVSGSSTEGIRWRIRPVVSLSDGLDDACLSIRHMAQLLQAWQGMQLRASTINIYIYIFIYYYYCYYYYYYCCCCYFYILYILYYIHILYIIYIILYIYYIILYFIYVYMYIIHIIYIIIYTYICILYIHIYVYYI